MGTSPEYLDREMKLKRAGKSKMSDVVMAVGFIKDIGGGGQVNVMLRSAHAFLIKHFKHKEEPEKRWTERRLRSWWNNECRKVEFWQMLELAAAAELAKLEREKKLAEARRDHAEFMQKTTSLIEALKLRDPAFYRGEIERLGMEVSRVALPGTDGE